MKTIVLAKLFLFNYDIRNNNAKSDSEHHAFTDT